MKKTMTLTLSLIALIALIIAPTTSFAGVCSGKTKTADDTKVLAHCSDEEAKACAAKLGLSLEECQNLCSTVEHEFVNLSIDGMTCVGCEKTITGCLEDIPGVMKVGLVSHKDGTAFVIIDSKQVKAEVLARAVTRKGYKAKVVPVVAKVEAGDSKPVSDKAGCGAMIQKVCSKACAKTCGVKAETETKTVKKTDGTK
ncbi:MAG: heavy-metal-associated domain-containing protein [candidate division Zixibacteria bacterium]|nr:heavy-metal-associated domain-containing protein [candidate division Zixibacteria bacterium]